MSLPSPAELSQFFDQLCHGAAAATLPLFRSKLDVSNKLADDFDPVTEADRNAETVIRDLLEKRFPDHGIIGEEFGAVRSEARYQWIIDPIDGTRAFISGLPVWGTLVGLYENGRPIAGVMDQPFTRERYLAIDGETHLRVDGGPSMRLNTRQVTELNQATLMTTSPHLLTTPGERAYFDVERQVKLFRYGCDCYAYCLLAAGQVDLVIESGLNIYDIAALIPIIEGAGGLVTSWTGGDASNGGSILAAANAGLHEQALELLNKPNA
ncbi:MAG: histidinol-phosphatase [Rhizobiaceae bacterium]|nr:histidinol-phosphatase [Rhizobiaceae bacterium]